MIKGCAKGRHGFTLVEVLVALALFMVLVTSLVNVSHLSVKASSVLKKRVKAISVLEQTMEAVMAVRASNFSNLSEGVFYPEIVNSKWELVFGEETVGGVERWVEISRIQREISCGGERVCSIVDSGGVVDPVTFKAEAVVRWEEEGEIREERLESLLTFWR